MFAEVHASYHECRKNKRGTINALKFETDVIENLQRLGRAECPRSCEPFITPPTQGG